MKSFSENYVELQTQQTMNKELFALVCTCATPMNSSSSELCSTLCRLPSFMALCSRHHNGLQRCYTLISAAYKHVRLHGRKGFMEQVELRL